MATTSALRATSPTRTQSTCRRPPRRSPAHVILLETDAPWLTPVPSRGRPNRPALVAEIYEFVAGLRGVAVEELAVQIEKNVRAAFPRLPALLGSGL